MVTNIIPSKFKIKLYENISKRPTVEVNGVDITNMITSMQINVDAGGIPRITLECIGDVDIERIPKQKYPTLQKPEFWMNYYDFT